VWTYAIAIARATYRKIAVDTAALGESLSDILEQAVLALGRGAGGSTRHGLGCLDRLLLELD